MPAELALLSLLLAASTVKDAPTVESELPPPALLEILGTSDADLIKNDIPLEPESSVARPSPVSPQLRKLR